MTLALRMHRFAVLFCCLFAMGACVSTDGAEGPTWTRDIPSTSSPVVSSTTSIAGPTTTTTSLAMTTTTEGDSSPARALITESGVVVTVRAQTTSGYLVITPCGAPTFVDGGTEIHHTDVVLDPGHGGPVDTGAVGPNGLAEKDINLEVAEGAATILRERGISVILTRTADYATPLGVRTELADSVGAKALISIHHNAPTPGISTMPGTEIFVQSDSAASARLGGLIYQNITGALASFSGVEWHAAPDAGVLEVHNPSGFDTYGMLRLPETLAVLAEIAYISSASEADLLASDPYPLAAATALADAVEAFLKSDAVGSGYIAEPRVFTAQASVGPSLCQEVALG